MSRRCFETPRVARSATRLRPLAAGALVLGLLIAFAPANARAEDDPPATFGAFKDLLLNKVGGQIDKDLASVQAKLADPKTSAADRAKLEKQKSQLQDAKNRVEDTKMVKGLWDSIQNAKNAVKEIADGVGADSSGSSAINVSYFEGEQVSSLLSSKNLNRLNTGIDYYNKIDALATDLQGVRDAGLTPGATRLSYALTSMTAIMSNFGDKVPLIGDFVKAYGDLGGQLLKNAIALEKKIKASEGGQIRPGVHGARKEMLDKLEKKGYAGAAYVPGLYDVYETDSGDIVIWDRKTGDWVVASDEEPGISKEELAKRYLFYAKQGVKTPGPELVLKSFRKTIKLELTPAKKRVTPNETVELKVTGTMVRDDKAAPPLLVVVKEESHSGWGSGSFVGSTSVKIGESVKWTAPDNTNENYVFSVDLDPDIAKGTAVSTGPAKATVLTGAATSMVLTAEPTDVVVGGDVVLTAKVSDADGQPLDAKASGWIDMTVKPDKGYLRMSKNTDGQKGIEQKWHAPDEAGTYTFTASYNGATGYGPFTSNTAGCEASVVVKVREPDFDLRVDQTSQSAKKDAPAKFTVTLSNREKDKVSFSIRQQAAPRGQSAYWRRSSVAGDVALEGGAEKQIPFTLVPDDEEKATTYKIKLTATPKAGKQGKSVIFAATNKEESEKLLVKISSSGKNGKATAGGKASLATEAGPGETISLTFRPWGMRRKYCTVDVVKKSKNMRQVELFSHGPDGCSFGTRDGRMRSDWSVAEEKVTWSGPGVKSGAGKRSHTAAFTVPDKPGTYTVTANGTVKWKFHAKRAGGSVNKTESESGSGSFTIEVEAPK